MMFSGTIGVSKNEVSRGVVAPTDSPRKELSEPMEDYTPIKTCSNPECGKTLPATLEYFPPSKTNKDGLRGWCRVCYTEYNRKYKQANKEAIREKDREYYKANRDSRIAYVRKYYQDNKEKSDNQKRQYRKANRKAVNERDRKWREKNREKVAESNKRSRNKNPENSRIVLARRRARKLGLPDTFTTKQWFACLEYFNHTCAVCGNQLRDLFGTIEPHRDHWIPLSSPECLGTVAENMVCLCSDCNCRKQAKLPVIWLTERYGTRKANIILQRIETYFEWVRSQNE
jgi:5-methylcytosine-specific restriction endonuclease McrA